MLRQAALPWWQCASRILCHHVNAASRSPQLSSTLGRSNTTMLDFVGFLTTPHLYIGAIFGFLVGLGGASLVYWAFPLSAPITLLALIIAAGCIGGLVVAASLCSEKRK